MLTSWYYSSAESSMVWSVSPVTDTASSLFGAAQVWELLPSCSWVMQRLGCVDTNRVSVAASRHSLLSWPLFVSLSAKRKQGMGSYQWDPSGCISFPPFASVLVWTQNINQPNQLHPFIHPSALTSTIFAQVIHMLAGLSSLSLAHIWRDGQLKDDKLSGFQGSEFNLGNNLKILKSI